MNTLSFVVDVWLLLGCVLGAVTSVFRLKENEIGLTLYMMLGVIPLVLGVAGLALGLNWDDLVCYNENKYWGMIGLIIIAVVVSIVPWLVQDEISAMGYVSTHTSAWILSALAINATFDPPKPKPPAEKPIVYKPYESTIVTVPQRDMARVVQEHSKDGWSFRQGFQLPVDGGFDVELVFERSKP